MSLDKYSCCNSSLAMVHRSHENQIKCAAREQLLLSMWFCKMLLMWSALILRVKIIEVPTTNKQNKNNY